MVERSSPSGRLAATRGRAAKAVRRRRRQPTDLPRISSNGGNPRTERLLASAALMFREKGYDGASTRGLAATLGIRSASLYYHIGRKEDLLYAICAGALARIQEDANAAVASETSPLAQLRALIQVHARTSLADRDKHATMLFELRALSGPRRREVIRLRDEYEHLVRETIARAQRSKDLRNDIPAKYLALALLNLLNWSIFWFRPGGDLTVARLGDVMAQVFLDGARWTQAGERGPRLRRST